MLGVSLRSADGRNVMRQRSYSYTVAALTPDGTNALGFLLGLRVRWSVGLASSKFAVSILFTIGQFDLSAKAHFKRRRMILITAFFKAFADIRELRKRTPKQPRVAGCSLILLRHASVLDHRVNEREVVSTTR